MSESRKIVYIEDNLTGEDKVLCPYCGYENLFLRNMNGDPVAVEKCEHFTSILMKATYKGELKYNHYARFREKGKTRN